MANNYFLRVQMNFDKNKIDCNIKSDNTMLTENKFKQNEHLLKKTVDIIVLRKLNYMELFLEKLRIF